MVKSIPNFVELDQRNMLQNYGFRELTLVKGKGSFVWDEFGQKYLDFTSGIAVNAFGHCFRPAVKAAQKQLKTLMHTSNLYLNKPTQVLASLLVNQTHLDSVFFCNSGTEANEAAIKFARGSNEKDKLQVISFEKSFHGRTYGSLSATGQKNLKNKFGKMLDGFKTLVLNDAEALKTECQKQNSIIIVEPLLAEGGIISLDSKFIRAIAECQKQGALLICDEVQTGLGRLGTFLGSDAVGLKPNIVTLAKGLGGGLPLGSVLVTKKIGETIKAGDHGSTFGGNPVACAASIQIVKAVMRSRNEIREKALHFKIELEKWVKMHSYLGFELDVLGRGLLLGIKCKQDVSFLINACRKEGLLLLKAGGFVVRFLPPLNVTYKEIDECIRKMTDAV